ncbi:MAG: HD domain-containing protein [Methanoregulaceae archaeon]|nr:HD domain-containing protein [Methanoregulaceae archaeon]
MDEKIGIIQAYVKTVLREPGSHGPDHTFRVLRMCERIGRDEGADMNILLPAALLHDIARPAEKERGIPHEEEGARMAEEFLTSIFFDKDLIPGITQAIRTHRYRSDRVPETLEAKILSDADKLDAMGAIGIARTFLRAGEHGGEITDAAGHIVEKLLKLKERMHTESAARIAVRRHGYLAGFLEELANEMDAAGI